MRIVFMGTPEFAVPTLAGIIAAGYEVAGVVTAPDKPGGRQGIQQSAVKLFAIQKGIEVLQPVKLRDPDFQARLHEINPDLQVVVAFRMLPESVWAFPRLGTLNLHGSLLPKYRGAAPINWAIINGETETGVTTFFLQHEIDTGHIILQEKMPIGPNETAGDLHDRMMTLGADVVLRTLRLIESGKANPQPQSEIAATHAPKIFTQTCKIDCQLTVAQVHNFVRGLSPFPGAWALLDDQIVKVYATELSQEILPVQVPGTLQVVGKKQLMLHVADGCLQIKELQLAGKKRMTADALLQGLSLDKKKLN
jgi:methionyl-tRNA formyltransferase